MSASACVVVTGANGLVGSAVCRCLSETGAQVRAVVRRPGTAPVLPGATEAVGDYADPAFARAVLAGADAAVTTVHPLGGDRDAQVRTAIEDTPGFAGAAAEAGASRLIHVSTAAVYERTAEVGDIDESGRLVGDGADLYAVSKRDGEAALARVDGITRVVLRPPAVLGPGPSSVWNSRRPAALRESPEEFHVNPRQTFAWVHVDDLARLAADLAVGSVPDGDGSGATGPPPGGWVAVNVAGEPATLRDYYATVAGALGVEPRWNDEPCWTGRLLTHRARSWGWEPRIGLAAALEELAAGVEG